MQLSQNPLSPALKKKADDFKNRHLKDYLFEEHRASDLVFNLDGFCLDLTRQKLDGDVLALLVEMAEAAGLGAKRDAMLNGEAVNNTENRPVIHTKLRDPKRYDTPEWSKLCAFVNDVRGNDQIKTVINLGIGGSDLGPAMMTEALAGFADGPDIHYVANVDPAHLHDVLAKIDPVSTLVIVTSKTFTTAETLSNANLARDWLVAAGIDVRNAMIGVTAAPVKAEAWGIHPDHIFAFDEGVGGRYSLWSAVGLPVMLGIGADQFMAFLEGAHQMDDHFATAPFSENLPVLMGLVRIWNRNFLDAPAYGLMPYDQHLHRLAAWAQQLEMESNGKRVDISGEALDWPASPLIWGEPGTNAQHSFFQYLHQGVDTCPIDILIALNPGPFDLDLDFKPNHQRLVANAVAQAEALALGQPNDAEPHRHFTGNRPSVVISWTQTNPSSLGSLLAFYEHVTAVCGFVWHINSFDQWGVELGKKMALAAEAGDSTMRFSPSATALLDQIK